MHKWIKNWLCKRKQRVFVNGSASDLAPVDSGLPQGSFLGHILFIIDIDVGLNNFIVKFADMKIRNLVISVSDMH